VTQVRGYADQLLRVKNNPYDPSNRRISILVKNHDGPLPNLQGGKMVDAAPGVAANQESPKSAQGATNSQNPIQPAVHTAKTPSAGTSAQTNPTAAQPSLMEKVKGLIPGGKK
jgi:chemotaxis protein MotB